MTKSLEKIKSYQNWFGKTVLWAIGIVMVVSQNYGFILKGFMLTENELSFEAVSYSLITSFGLLFIVGGIYLNKFLEKFTSNGGDS